MIPINPVSYKPYQYILISGQHYMPMTEKQVHLIAKELMDLLLKTTERRQFFSHLSRLLRKDFHFDRLCINLYDHRGEVLTYFTAVEGTTVSTLSPVRPAESSSTIAGHVIKTRRPVIITDLADFFPNTTVHPMAEAGLCSTMAFPLFLNNEIIATLHCSFAEKPNDFYSIASFLVMLSPILGICLGAILSFESMYNQDDSLLENYRAALDESPIVFHSEAMRKLMREVNLIASLDIPVLILGETGTGKSLMAQHIHKRSPRRKNHFVKVNCPSLPETLFESELFGHSKGAFTGAASSRIGRFELAHNGTLFLDEIAELAPNMQSKLLQVLEDSYFERVGESVPISVDIKLIAATNRDISQAIESKILRSDLFYRLSRYILKLPPLRERQADIAPLVSICATEISAQLGLKPIKPNKKDMAPLLDYSWPGNVRELKNVVAKMAVYTHIHGTLTANIVAELIQQNNVLQKTEAIDSEGAEERTAMQPVTDSSDQSYSGYEAKSINDVEKEHIIKALRHTKGIISGPDGAAKILGLPRSTLQHRMKKLGINKDEIL